MKPALVFPPVPWMPKHPVYEDAVDAIGKLIKQQGKRELQLQYVVGFYAMSAANGGFGDDHNVDDLADALDISRTVMYERKKLAESFNSQDIMNMCVADVAITTATKLCSVDDPEIRQIMLDKALAKKVNSANFDQALSRAMASNRRIAAIDAELDAGENKAEEGETISHEGDVGAAAAELCSRQADGFKETKKSAAVGDSERMSIIISSAIKQLTKCLQSVDAMEFFTPDTILGVYNDLKFLADNGDGEALARYRASSAKLQKLYQLSLNVTGKLMEVNGVFEQSFIPVDTPVPDSEDQP